MNGGAATETYWFMNHRLTALVVFLAFGIHSALAAAHLTEETLRKMAQRIHAHSILVDGHNDITGAMTDAGYDLGENSTGLFHTDLARLKQGAVSAQFFSVWIDPAKYFTNGGTTRALKMIDAIYRGAAAHPRDLVL